MNNIQAIVFLTTDGWTPDKARYYLKKHNYHPIKKMHKKKTELRYRLQDPTTFDYYKTKKLNDGILLVLGYNNNNGKIHM